MSEVLIVTTKLGDICAFRSTTVKKGDRVYTQPPAAQQPLSNAAIHALNPAEFWEDHTPLDFARLIEQAHGITGEKP